jgi:hypothetical protein
VRSKILIVPLPLCSSESAAADGDKGPSKKALKKQAKEAEKAAKKADKKAQSVS